MSVNPALYFTSRTPYFPLNIIRNIGFRTKHLRKAQKLFVNRKDFQPNNFQWEKSYQTTSSVNLLEEPNIVKSPCKELIIPSNVSLPEFIWEQGLKHHAQNKALVDDQTGKLYTYKEAYEESKRFSISLTSLSIVKGDVVAIFMPNRPEYIISLLGILGIGGIATTINPNYKEHEVARQLSASNTRLIVTVPSLIDIVEGAIEVTNATIKVIVVGEDGNLSEENYYSYDDVKHQIDHDRIKKFSFESTDSEEVALLPYSSGTTGLPKGVMLTTKNLISNIYQNVYGDGMKFIKLANDSYQSKTICVLPMFHVFGLCVTSLPTLRAGGLVVTLPKFDPNMFTRALREFRPTFLHLVPPLVDFCANHKSVTPQHLSSVEHIMVNIFYKYNFVNISL